MKDLGPARTMLSLAEFALLFADTPAWIGEALLWIALAALLALVVAAVGVWTLGGRVAALAADTGRLSNLDTLAADLARMADEREGLDLHRIEHVLVDMRDAQARVEDALLHILESQAAEKSGAQHEVLVPHPAPESLSERVVNRLLSLGFSQVQLVTPLEELQAMNACDGEVVVEAKRGGVLHKGRVLLRNGRLAEVDVKPSYAIFP